MEITEPDFQMLLEDIHQAYGYNFQSYSKASLKRRINRTIALEKFPSFAELRYKALNDADFFAHFLQELTVNVSEMFRDPYFYKALRTHVLPQLATHPYIRIWHAGCSTGEEVYSMAIMLKEEGLLDRTLLYATDINQDVLEQARSGMFDLSVMKSYSENYNLSGGKANFSDYYTARYDKVVFNKELSKKAVFSIHNLVSDESFNEFHLILCRNVLIYFDKDLQKRVFRLFTDSLNTLGFLALGSKESMIFSEQKEQYKPIDKKEKIWMKVK